MKFYFSILFLCIRGSFIVAMEEPQPRYSLSKMFPNDMHKQELMKTADDVARLGYVVHELVCFSYKRCSQVLEDTMYVALCAPYSYLNSDYREELVRTVGIMKNACKDLPDSNGTSIINHFITSLDQLVKDCCFHACAEKESLKSSFDERVSLWTEANDAYFAKK